MPYAGIPVGTWQFKPADAAYQSVYGSVDIVVNQATPTIETPAAVVERTYDPTKTLEDSDLTGGVVRGVDGTALEGTWSWKQAGIVPTVDNSGYEAVFTETGTKNYTPVSTTVAVKVKKAEPEVAENPTAAEITWGESLADSVLSGGTMQHSSGTAVSGSFAWKDATIKPNVADSNQTAYTVVFTPDDTDNYEITETTITLNIRPAGNTPNLPADEMSVPYGCKKIKDVQLPDGWAWADTDLETELVAGKAVQATAVYNGEGHGNYETESVSIAITRLACTHENTEVRGAKAAGCGVNGYTGDTFCKDCGALLEKGKTVAALTHDYQETGIQQPTDDADGYKIYTCSHCKDSYTVTIPKTSSGSGGDNGSGSSGNAGSGNGNGSTSATGGTNTGANGGSAGGTGSDSRVTDGNTAGAGAAVAGENSGVDGTTGDTTTGAGDGNDSSVTDAGSNESTTGDAGGTDKTTAASDGADRNEAENNRNRHVSLFAIIVIVIAAGAGMMIILIGKKRRKREDETEH